ncbi:hypothetical protein D1159_17065 [Pseudoflavonifractor sp. 524-17]|uniref:hypothetical protein n=1 Tax=Pseudoflavonifractor sp. 524-17 TaxID=2304577 RepID=UPI00137A930B|nr:hypothetical protein [Pseudoflavonifractor sp. 524-17]NCE66236.1 hypothetical protein [Pseudoflavonifractor sp. 524-17]
MVTYTAIFGSDEAQEEVKDPNDDSSHTDTAASPVDLSALKRPLIIGGAVLVLAAGGFLVFKKLKERR